MSGIVDLGVVGLQRAVASGRLRAAEVAHEYFDRIDRFDAALNCYVALDRDRALADAERALTGDDARALEGVPIAIKANIAVAGLATTAGFGRGDTAGEDAEVVSRLRAAGAIIVGHVNMHEGALGATTDNPHFGATHNPWRHGYTPGGSSGGSGAAVAAGLSAASLGTDTLGSVRIPASYTGVYGLKPTHALVPDAGLVPLSAQFDVIGPLARSLGDLAAIMAVIAPLAAAQPIAKVATLDILGRSDLARDVRRSYLLAVDLLAGTGLDIQQFATGALDLARLRLAALVAIAQEAAGQFDTRMATEPAAFSADFRRILDFARGFDVDATAKCAAVVAEARGLIRGILADAEAIILPTTPQTAFAHSADTPLTQPDFTQLANIAGLPALSLPAGLSADGLPVGVQLIGREGGERTLIALAGRLDAVLKGYAEPPGYD